ncbi:MAG: deoxyribodipyrimidine photo-lyase [Micropruina sp.]|nr:deoxyribodipyrimidine photo-lyase [Micropruina sp.]
MTTSLLWLRRDLRRADHPALAEAARQGEVAVCFVVDPFFFDDAGLARQAWFAATLNALDETFDGALIVRHGDPLTVIPTLAREVGATSVHVSTETEPDGAARDRGVRAALADHGIVWVETGSPYAVTPGRVLTLQGSAYQVFTPFSRAWRAHGWRLPASEPTALTLRRAESDPDAWAKLAEALLPGSPTLPAAGQEAALDRWHTFLDEGLLGYATQRDRPDLDGTSLMSPYLASGVVHPRTLLADLEQRGGPDAERVITELAWREFYADVLARNPHSLWEDLRDGLRGLSYDEAPALVEAWKQGRTGFPIVDAGMRQLAATGWMHNRVRMITASFLTKDLHTWWPIGARYFLEHLIDGDDASNSHGWQWVAGTGTDAAPYFRVFNPILQGRKFDPQGAYVRRWVPELSHLIGASCHEPWTQPSGYAHGYPRRIVDHDHERKVALERYKAVRA